ncbi:NAD(P)/FAD-dependent oxidoreductase [Leifsonia shinshuensis]|uniref:3-phenylpropionate/trans-cinnamate dioxygenase ferredoxin reductase subunit n=1 Tax=Leifsonia shinshuensis TaxID=150026 RepID=A0A853CSE5_9MICO|nr:FAD-dependent oxidoreductase [Leifsonia shinshuensis]NYJ23269.1 3-phenylpropionate/trans-cinnamate dioxygenase ferredoxin reductase subunit [Leifsonia shinshuensis]
MSNPTVVIAGAGLAGATTAVELRARGFGGRILLLGAEEHHPYIRPPLSKEYLKGESDLDDAYVQPADWYTDNDVELLPGTEAGSFDPAAHELFVSGGARITYDSLVLATGAHARPLGVPGSGHGAVFSLRTIEDSQWLRSALEVGSRRVVVVGSGWIGMEVAAAARGYGNEVTVVGRSHVPLAPAIGPELGAVFESLHRDNGVVFRNAAHVVAVEGGDQQAVVLATGEHLAADVVVAGVGAAPNTSVAEQSGLALENGVPTDEGMRTVVEDVYAVGDLANPLLPAIGQRLRNEHWANAIAGGTVAARSIVGEAASYDDIPYFYSDQYDLGMEYSGYAPLAAGARVVFRGDVSAREFIAFWLRDDRVVAGMNVNVWDVQEQIQRLIRSGGPVDPERLTDESVDLAEL